LPNQAAVSEKEVIFLCRPSKRWERDKF
jgi:hypothetical protein